MEQIFLKLLNLSLIASWLILAVILLRALLKKAPKWTVCLLWGLVALRLVCPFTLESVTSLIPSAEPIPPDIVTSPAPTITSGIAILNSTVNPFLSETLAPDPAASTNPMQKIVFACTVIWIIGMAAMLVYMLTSYILIRRKVREAVKADGYYLCDAIGSPFILGVIHPRIYMPSSLSEEDIPYALSHEKAHIKRLDHIIKPLAFLLLSVYWFQPLVWVAYILLCRDIEFACDEKVIKKLGVEHKALYSEALLECSISRGRITACPLAFGEVGVKERVKNVLSYKKPAFWIILIALLACIALAVFFLTDPLKDNENPDPDNSQVVQTESVYFTYNPTLSSSPSSFTPTFNLSYTAVDIEHEGGGQLIIKRADGTEEILTKATLSPEDSFTFLPTDGGVAPTCTTAKITLTFHQKLTINLSGSGSQEYNTTKTATLHLYRVEEEISDASHTATYRVELGSADFALAHYKSTKEYIIYPISSATLFDNQLTWHYNLAMSASWHSVLPIHFDTDYTELRLSCSDGGLSLKSGCVIFGEPTREIVSISPSDEITWALRGGATGDVQIEFQFYREDDLVGSGTIHLTQEVGKFETK